MCFCHFPSGPVSYSPSLPTEMLLDRHLPFRCSQTQALNLLLLSMGSLASHLFCRVLQGLAVQGRSDPVERVNLTLGWIIAQPYAPCRAAFLLRMEETEKTLSPYMQNKLGYLCLIYIVDTSVTRDSQRGKETTRRPEDEIILLLEKKQEGLKKQLKNGAKECQWISLLVTVHKQTVYFSKGGARQRGSIAWLTGHGLWSHGSILDDPGWLKMQYAGKGIGRGEEGPGLDQTGASRTGW